MQPLQQSQTVNSNSSNIPTHKPSNNFQQQTLPRYNPPPNPQHVNNPARRIQRGRYSTGTTTSLIPPPGSFLSQQTPLASPALSTTSTAISHPDTQHQQKSHIPFPSRLPTQQDMLKFQVRKSETEATNNTNQTVTSNPTNAQIQVSLSHNPTINVC